MRGFKSTLLIPLMISAFFLSGFATPEGENLVDNGNFETGDLTGWTIMRINESGDWFVYTGTMLPFTTLEILPPPVGNFAATTDQFEPVSTILYQDIDVPSIGETFCSAILYYVTEEDGGGEGGGVGSLSSFTRELTAGEDDLSTERVFFNRDNLLPIEPNQQYRIDIMDPEAEPFEVGNGVLLNLFQTEPGDPEELGYTTIEFDLTPYAGQTVRLRAAVVVTVGPLAGAIDNIVCTQEQSTTAIPTLSEWGLIIMAGLLVLAGIIFYRKRTIRV